VEDQAQGLRVSIVEAAVEKAGCLGLNAMCSAFVAAVAWQYRRQCLLSPLCSYHCEHALLASRHLPFQSHRHLKEIQTWSEDVVLDEAATFAFGDQC